MTDTKGAQAPTPPARDQWVRHRVVRRHRLQRGAVVAIIVLGALAAIGGLWLIFSMSRGVFPYR